MTIEFEGNKQELSATLHKNSFEAGLGISESYKLDVSFETNVEGKKTNIDLEVSQPRSYQAYVQTKTNEKLGLGTSFTLARFSDIDSNKDDSQTIEINTTYAFVSSINGGFHVIRELSHKELDTRYNGKTTFVLEGDKAFNKNLSIGASLSQGTQNQENLLREDVSGKILSVEKVKTTENNLSLYGSYTF